MSDAGSPLVGPDLTLGVPEADVREGVPLLGHANGEAVLLSRVDGALHAVGATCAHYGAPLAEGLVVDGTIRCPWHHAAFDLTSGQAVRAPALGPLPCWSVVVRDGVAVVEGRRAHGHEPRPARRPRTSALPESVVVIGGGAAGLAAVATLRDEGYEGPITLVSAERERPVDRPNLSKDFLAGTAGEDWLPLKPDDWYAEREVRVLTDRRALLLDVANRRVTLDDARQLTYGALLLATGAAPVRLDLGHAARVHYLRTADDARAIIEAATRARSAVVIGASFIGLEVAASLRHRGVEVTVVAPESQPLERVLGAGLGRVVRDVHERHGVRFVMNRTVRAADADAVVLHDGTRLRADLVVAGVGVRPVIDLAARAGLATDRGVVVDEYLRSTAPFVRAAGDIARWPDPHTGRPLRVEHWVVAQRQGQTAARNMLGAKERFDAVPFFWSAHHEVTIAYVGHAERPDRIDVDGDPASGDCAVRYFERSRLAAVATIGRDVESLRAELAMEGAGAASRERIA